MQVKDPTAALCSDHLHPEERLEKGLQTPLQSPQVELGFTGNSRAGSATRGPSWPSWSGFSKLPEPIHPYRGLPFHRRSPCKQNKCLCPLGNFHKGDPMVRGSRLPGQGPWEA